MAESEIYKEFLKIKPVGSLEVVVHPNSGWLAYYDGDGELKRVEVHDISIGGGTLSERSVTVSTEPPSGVPLDGEQWIQYTP